MTARVIQHEVRSLRGNLFVDYLQRVEKALWYSLKLIDISKVKSRQTTAMIYPLGEMKKSSGLAHRYGSD